MAQPFPVVVTNAQGGALTITGATTGVYSTAAPFPVVLCDSNGNIQNLGASGAAGIMVARSAAPVQGTATTGEQILATMTVPAGLLTATGQIKFEAALATGAMAGTYTLNVRVGGIGGTAIVNIASAGATSFQRVFGTIAARGTTSSQISWCWGKLGSANQNVPDTASAKDFTASVDIVVTITLTNSADNTLVTLEGYNLVVYP